MYTIHYKYNGSETMFFRDDLPVDELKLIDSTLKLAANSAGSLDFTMPSINVMYDGLQRMRGLVKVRKKNKLIWEGRVLTEDADFWQNKTIYCEGILACLNDTRHPQMLYQDITLYQYMESILSIHNQKVDDDKKFVLGAVSAGDNPTIGTKTTSYESTWELINALLDEYGGYIRVRYDENNENIRYIDYLKDCTGHRSYQTIEFGVNLIDFTRSYDMSSLCTVLLPLGKVIASAGNNTIGEIIDSRLADGHYISENDFNIYYDSSIAGAYAASNTYFPVEAGKTYYISCRNHGGRVMWALKDASGNLVDYYSARTGEGMTDLIESKLEVPPSDVGNNYLLAIAGFGADIQPRVNASIEADEAFDKYTTVEDVNGGSVYVVNQNAVTTYGWIEKQLTWNDIDDPNELKRVAEMYLAEGQFDEMSISLTAVDLQMMGADADEIAILDEVEVISAPHGLKKMFPVTELTIKMGEPSANKLTLGHKTEQTLSGVVSDATNDIFSKINAIPSQSATLIAAKKNATQLINNATNGIFTLEYNDEGVNSGFRISNVEDWNTDGAKGWRFTMGGIGYYGDGFDKDVTIAITGQDGGIVANSITTGSMLADHIRGGDLILGRWKAPDWVDTNGVVHEGQMLDGDFKLYSANPKKDSNGNLIPTVHMNKDGAFINGEILSEGESGFFGSAAQTVHIKNGWIYGSDENKGKISVDTQFEIGYSEKGVSIEGPVIAIMSPHVWYGDNINDLQEGLNTFVDSGNTTLEFNRGALVGVNYNNVLSDSVTFQCANANITLHINNGIISGCDVDYI